MRALTGSSSLLTYEPYYGLREKPFSLSTDPRFLYRSSEHAKTFDDLLLAIRRREGLIVLTGDIGTGKTTLCKAVLESLDRKTFTTFVPDPFITREDLLKRMLIEFGAMSVDDLKSDRMHGASHSALSYPLYDFLKSLVPLQAFAVLIIDETQNLALPLLEEIRILSDLESPEKLLQVVLVGQLELRSKLKLPEMRQLDQRVSARCSLQALTRDALSGYIAHRLDVAGGTDDRVHFSPDAIDEIFAASGGVPRVINLICDRALYLGYQQRKSVIEPPEVMQSIEHLGVGHLTAAPVVNETPTPAPAPEAPVPPAAQAPAFFQTPPILPTLPTFQTSSTIPTVPTLTTLPALPTPATLTTHATPPTSQTLSTLPTFPTLPTFTTLPTPETLPTPATPPTLPTSQTPPTPSTRDSLPTLATPSTPETPETPETPHTPETPPTPETLASPPLPPVVPRDPSGLELHDIPNDVTSPVAVSVPRKPDTSYMPMLTKRANDNRALLDESAAARKWRLRALRVAFAVGVALTFMTFVVVGEVTFMNYYPEPSQVPLEWPEPPPPPRMARPAVPIETPSAVPLDATVLGAESRPPAKIE